MQRHLPKQLLGLLILVLAAIQLNAQSYTMDGTPIDDCDGFFLDSGGSNGDYDPNENFTTTICPGPTGGTHVQLVFSGLDLGDGDVITFYDSNTADPDAEFELVLPTTPGQPFIIQATAANPSGCITIVFTSDGTNQGAGWSADINCTVACQTIQANLASTTPAVMPIDTGWIDICPGDRVLFNGEGLYPQNGIAYQHSDATSSFEWDFGDGNTALGPNVSNIFEEPGGYVVQLTITDQLGCRNTNFISQRVRVSTYPSYELGGTTDPTLCAGDTIELVALVDSLSSEVAVSVQPTQGSFQQEGIRSDTLLLPDGTGVSYTSSVAFNQFPPGATLTNPDCILGVDLHLEHSYGGDLDIELICPNGQSVYILDYPSGVGSTNFGEPYATGPVDGNSADLTPGIPYIYTFVNSGSTFGTLTGGGSTYTYTTVPSENTGVTHTYNDSYFPEGTYEPEESFDNLIGCPLNGEWTIRVQDNLGLDNGWLFQWSIAFCPELFSVLETYTPNFIDWGWEENPTIFFESMDSIAATPANAGTAGYTFWVEDDFGCVNDTTINFTVLPETHPDCYNCDAQVNDQADAIICEDESIPLDLSPTSPLEQAVTFESFPQYEFGASNHPPSNPYRNTLNVNSIQPGFITDPATQIESVCIDILTDWDADLVIILEAPNGTQLLLSSNNGGGGDNYTNTCFSPTAVTPIQSGSAPFTGVFQPEGNWNNLVGEFINGDWTLIVSDAFGVNDLGELVSWSITFNNVNEFTYSWSPVVGLTCDDCPTPVATPTMTTAYEVNINDNFGCNIIDTILVGVIADIPAPAVSCLQIDEDILFDWDPLPGFDLYEVNIITNGMATGWMGPTSDNSVLIEDLANGDEVTVEVRVFFDNAQADCDVPVGSSSCTFSLCGLAAQAESTPVSCVGIADGTITVNIISGDAPYSISLNGEISDDFPTVSDLAAGTYAVAVLDDIGCIFETDVIIGSPDSLTAAITIVEEVDCNGAAVGGLQAIPGGGTPDYSYNWEGPSSGNTETFDELVAGTYNLTITDDNGCEATAAETLTEPEALAFEFVPIEPSCFNTLDGSLTVVVTGGTGNYSYNWDDNSAADQITGLTAGTFCVTVTDENNCTIEDCFDLSAPAELVLEEISSDPTSCFAGEDGTATALASGGTGELTYQWNDNLQQVANTAIQLTAGMYTVEITDEQDCSITADIEVTEPTELTVDFTSEDVNCNGGNDGTATALPGGGTGPFTFAWSNGNTEATAISLEAGMATVTVTDNNGCVEINSIDLTEPAEAVTAAAQQTVEGCFGEAENEATVLAGGGTGTGYTYQWSNDQDAETATGLAAGAYSVTVLDGNGCSTTTDVEVVDLEEITFNLLTELPTCNGSIDGGVGVNQIVGGAGNLETDYNFEWSTGSTEIAIPNIPGGETYTVTVTDQQGCFSVQSRFLEDPEPVTFELSSEPVSCADGNDGQASVINVTGPNGGYTYSWDINTGGQNTATAVSLPAGQFSVTVEDSEGCFAVNQIDIAEPSPIEVRLESDDNDCFGDNSGAISAIVNGGVPGYTYNWSNSGTEADLNGLTAGTYSLTLTDNNGCEEIVETTIGQPATLVASASGESVSCFGGRDGRVTVNTDGGTPPFTYSLDNQTYIGSNVFIGLSAGSYNLYIQDANGCQFTATATVEEPEEFMVDAGIDLTIIYGDSIQLIANALNPQGAVEFVWSEPYDGTLSCTECPGPFASPEYTIDYELYGIDENGCEDTDMLRLFVEKPKVVEVPSGFTPNNDGMNDLLLVHGRPGTLVKRFQVFDRWGEMIFSQGNFLVNDPTIGWDGTFRDQLLNSGVYVWHLVVEYEDGEEESFRGETTLIR